MRGPVWFAACLDQPSFALLIDPAEESSALLKQFRTFEFVGSAGTLARSQHVGQSAQPTVQVSLTIRQKNQPDARK